MNLANSTFSWERARRLANFSSQAYFVTTCADRATRAQALVRLDQDGNIVVAFRGSREPQDFLQDGKFWRRPLGPENAYCAPYTQVHAGFLQDFAAIAAGVAGQVREYLKLNPSAQIYLTGHSLGGALAILCALEFYRQQLPVSGVYTFGCPRVGNAVFAKIYNAALRNITFSLVNADDPIPLLPPLLAGYRDCGQEIFLPSAYCLNPEPVMNPWIGLQLIDDCLGALDSWRHHKLAFIPRHLMAAYIRRIEYIA